MHTGTTKMINARELFAPVYANSLYTAELRASRHWPSLAGMMTSLRSDRADATHTFDSANEGLKRTCGVTHVPVGSTNSTRTPSGSIANTNRPNGR